MRNREMCKKCKYKGGSASDHFRIFCDYSGKTDSTALKALKKGKHSKAIDSRGDDMNDCKLFEPADGVSENPLKRLWREDKV